MNDIAYKNMLFDRSIDAIKSACSEIETCTHLFDRTRRYDTALEKLDLRQSVKELRACAILIERIERRLRGPHTAFPDRPELQAAE
jgi:hypothetical protein